MPDHYRLIIVGAGVVGCSAAYHFAKLGWRDVLVLDKGDLGANDGSTSHAPGGMFLTNSSKMMTEFAKYSRSFYAELEPVDGQDVLFPVGGIEVAYTPERLRDLERRRGWARAYGLDPQIISPAETKQLIPLLDDSVIHGSFYTPYDAVAKGVRLMQAIMRATEALGGVQFQGNTPVSELVVRDGSVVGVATPQGTLAAEQVLLCTNIWAPVLAEQVGVHIPLMAAQHLYTVTTPVAELKGTVREVVHPLIRHQDHAMYFRQHGDCYGVGSYRHVPLMVDPHALGKSAILDWTPDHFTAGWESATELLPPLRNTDLVTRFNGMFAFSIDGYPVIGETAVRNLWACTALWLTHAGGAGRAIAEWMSAGTPPLDLREADITRFHAHQLSRVYVHERCAQNYREVYDIIHPAQPISTPRNVRVSPWHSRLEAQGGVFFQSGGWEYAQWYANNAPLLDEFGSQIPGRDHWASQFWSPIQGAEHLAVRERVGLFNLAALAVIEVSGPGALPFLNQLAANQIDRPVGRIVYTSLLNARGGIVSDLTVARLAQDRFWVITGGSVLPHDLAWITGHAPRDGTVTITDRSSGLATVGLWGPRARTVLAKLAQQDVSHEAFPYYTSRPLTIDTVPAYALRVSYAGELGWELYAPTEYALKLWDLLWEAGQEAGMVLAGSGAFDSLRLEKGYRLWGADIHTDYTPYEAGIGWAVRLDKGEFVGRAALVQQQSAGLTRKLCCLRIDQPGATLLGKEPIVYNGTPVGYVASANYGYSVGTLIAYGYLPSTLSTPGTSLTVEYFGEPLHAVVSDEPLFDAKSERMKR